MREYYILDNLDRAATFAAFHETLVAGIDHAVATAHAHRHFIALSYRHVWPGLVNDKSANILIL